MTFYEFYAPPPKKKGTKGSKKIIMYTPPQNSGQ